jgi:dihydroxyacetone kinase
MYTSSSHRLLADPSLESKIAGHLAASGASLDEVEHIAKIIASSSGTIGVGLDHCHVPGTDVPKESFLKADEGEMGMGIVCRATPYWILTDYCMV